MPVILDAESIAGRAYKDAVGRFLGEELPHRFLEPEKKPGLLRRLFGGRAA
jgi:septum site-determining protein MinD